MNQKHLAGAKQAHIHFSRSNKHRLLKHFLFNWYIQEFSPPQEKEAQKNVPLLHHLRKA